MALCPSVSMSVTSRCSTKTAKRSIKQTTPHDSPGTLVFWRQKSPRNSIGVTEFIEIRPYEGTKCRCMEWVKIDDFRQITGYISKTVQDRCTSRVCAVAQYAVLEANAKVNGRGQFSHPLNPWTNFDVMSNILLRPPGSWCAKFGWNRFSRYGSAHAWKNTVCVDFFY